MSKIKPIEFTDYASADAFLRSGRDPNRRPLSDGWNTQLLRVKLTTGDDTFVLNLHGHDMITWFKSGDVVINVDDGWSHVKRERANRYAFVNRPYRLNRSDQIEYRVSEVPEASGPVPIWVPVARAENTIMIDDHGVLTRPIWRAPSSVDVRTAMKAPLREYTRHLKKQLAEGVPGDFGCRLCMPFDGGRSGVSLGDFAQDRRHLYAHVISKQIPTYLLLWGARMVRAVADLDWIGYDLASNTVKPNPSMQHLLVLGLQRYLKQRF